MPRHSLAHVRVWVFDLDNTLYPPSARLFDQIEQRMTAYVMRVTGAEWDHANHLRRQWWHDHGTTLAGLMACHRIDPEDYLQDVHDISFAALRQDPVLATALAALPGRRIIHTNGSAPYARRVIAARGLTGLFDAVYGVEHAGYVPKPQRAAFDAVFARDGLDPTRAAMFEDDARNLAAPHAMGLRTIHVAPAPQPAPHIHHHTDDLSQFLAALCG